MTTIAEGDLFAVPLPVGGYGVGLAARVRAAIVLGYFFARRRDHVPAPAEAADDVVWIHMFGDLGIHEGRWPVLGRLPDWNREDWPVPAFGHRQALTGRLLRRDYGEDIDSLPRETRVTEEEFAGLPEDGLGGAGFVELRLTRLLVLDPLSELVAAASGRAWRVTRDEEFVAHCRDDLGRLIACARGELELTAGELDEIEARCERAGPGPWVLWLESDGGLGGSNVIIVGPDDDQPDLELLDREATDADWKLIAAARNEIPGLLKLVRGAA